MPDGIMLFARMRKYIIAQLILLMLLLPACGSKEANLKPLSPQDVIVAFGDSLTYGTGAPQGMGYPENLEKLIGHKVINAGVPGEETSDSLTRISAVLEEYHPALVIVCIGGNDNMRKRNPDQIKAHIETIVKTIQSQGSQVVLIAEPAFDFSLYVPEYYQQVGTEYSIPVDLQTLVTLLKQPNLKSDYVHFNANGYQAFANSIAQFLRDRGAV